jgi:hypothetical protein
MTPSEAPKVAKTKLGRPQASVILSEAKDLIALATTGLVRFSWGPPLRSAETSRTADGSAGTAPRVEEVTYWGSAGAPGGGAERRHSPVRRPPRPPPVGDSESAPSFLL